MFGSLYYKPYRVLQWSIVQNSPKFGMPVWDIPGYSRGYWFAVRYWVRPPYWLPGNIWSQGSNRPAKSYSPRIFVKNEVMVFGDPTSLYLPRGKMFRVSHPGCCTQCIQWHENKRLSHFKLDHKNHSTWLRAFGNSSSRKFLNLNVPLKLHLTMSVRSTTYTV